MSVSLDASVNGMVSQSMSMNQLAVQMAAQVKLAKSVHAMQESVVMTLISSAGLTTYDQSGAMQTVVPPGQKVNAVG